jgi:hypothetical protein
MELIMAIDMAALRAKLAAQKAGAPEVIAPVPVVPSVQPVVPVKSAGDSLNQEISLGELNSKISELSDMLLSAHPRMPVLLREIHSTLKQQPDNITLLSEEEIGVIVNGLIKHTGVELADKIIKSKTKSVKSIGLLDL